MTTYAQGGIDVKYCSKKQCGVKCRGFMDSSYRFQNCDKRETWLEQSVYKSQLTAGNRVEINSIGTRIQCASKVVLRKQNFSTSHALR